MVTTHSDGRDRVQPNAPASDVSRRLHRAVTLGAWTLAGLTGFLLLATVAGGLWGWTTLRASLPIAEGTLALPGLADPVTLKRDALGVVTITGRTRPDVARATGFVHAQERFFQMDLQRRQPAGELAELVGRSALPLDRASRIHRFRARAARILAAATAEEQALLAAYTGGVNAGLAALREKPFEYVLLRSEPVRWRMEDSILVVLSMFMRLQDERGTHDLRRGLLLDHLPAPLSEFLLSLGSDWDTPLQGPRLPPPVIPAPEVSLRRAGAASAPSAAATQRRRRTVAVGQPFEPESFNSETASIKTRRFPSELDLVPGSNGWAVAGAHTASGSALLASDMHLGHSVPNVWFRALLVWGDGSPGGPARVVGVTLPGVPSLIAGSNGHVAWAFTNAEVDTTDLVIVEPDPADPLRYLAPGGSRAYEDHREAIAVDGESDVFLEVRETIWGPVIGEGSDGRPQAVRWVAHEIEGVNVRLLEMERSHGLTEALNAAQRAGIPAQNCVVAHKMGGIGWTIAGRLPRRVGFDGRVPASWADGSRGWQGWLEPAQYPKVLHPPNGRIVTANNRLVGGEALRVLGEGAFDQGARARQIRDRLMEMEKATPQDMLSLHLDDRALFLARWRQLALDLLTPTAIKTSPRRREFRALLERTWTGRATPDSVAYRLVRMFRMRTAELAFAPFLASLPAADTRFPSLLGRATEGALWQLITGRPDHLRDPGYPSWDALLLAAIDRTAEELTAGGKMLSERTWGEINRLAMRHPLSGAVPFSSLLLDMEARPLPGDAHMPRVQAASFGASERFVVSPGRESEGLFHMPGGQSGHPLSRAYRAGHDAWVEGRATPLLPGPTVSTLELVPATP